MIRGRVIVCIASSWDYDPTSKHHVMRLLAKNNDIVWVNYHGTRKPRINAADARSALSALRRFAGGVRKITPGMVQVTPLVIPGASRPRLARLSQSLLVRQIRGAIRAVDPARSKPLQVWSFAPDVDELIGRFDEECFVYYCVDEFAEFEGVDGERIRKSEAILLKEADVVVTTSATLHEKRVGRRPDAILLRHGVDHDHFSKALRRNPAQPEPLDTIPRPMFGFFGMIHHWIDVDLIAAVAELRPHYSFVLLGESLTDVSTLRRIPNVYLLGRRPYVELPAYCAQFVAGLLPFRRTSMTENVNPIKLLEYLAAGLPVISTAIPEALRIGEPVQTADTPAEFARACDVVAAGPSPARRREISGGVANETWAARVDQLSALIGQKLTQSRSRHRRSIPLLAQVRLGGRIAPTAGRV